MAEFVFSNIIAQKGKAKDFYVFSRATSTEEIGNDMDYRVKSILRKNNIEYTCHTATQIISDDYECADYVFAMDGYNLQNLERRFGKSGKIMLLNYDKEISDPWYTGEFQKAFDDIYSACRKRLEEIIIEKNIS